MRLTLSSVVAAAACLFAAPALAQTQPYEPAGPPQDWTVDLGVGAMASQDAGGDTGSETRVVPYIAANWRDVVYFSPFEGVGWNIVRSDSFRAGVQVRPRFSPEDIEGLGLERPDFGADAAIYAFQRLPGNVVIGGRISRDISDVSDGTEYYASVGHQRRSRIGVINLTAFARGGDARLADAYYGVSPAEAGANGIAAYEPGGGLQGAGVNALLLVPLNRQWGVGAMAGYERRLGDVADSPLSRSDSSWRVGTFVARRFGG